MNAFGSRSYERDIAALEAELASIHRRLADRRAIASSERQSAGPFFPSEGDSGGELMAKAKAIYNGRRAREKLIDTQNLFGEPAWDLLLDLFVNAVANRPISVTSATIAACVPATTAMRWIMFAEKIGLVERYPDRFDRRRAFLRLTDRGLTFMRNAILVA